MILNSVNTMFWCLKCKKKKKRRNIPVVYFNCPLSLIKKFCVILIYQTRILIVLIGRRKKKKFFLCSLSLSVFLVFCNVP